MITTKGRKIWLAIILFLICAFSCSCAEIAGGKEVEISSTRMSVEYNEYLGYSATITGTAKNNTMHDLSYVQIEFAVYDNAGNNLGTALANINNLLGGDTWSFEATLLSFPTAKPTTYKLVDITSW